MRGATQRTEGQPCPQLLNGDSSLAFFCLALNVTRQIANPRYERRYSLTASLVGFVVCQALFGLLLYVRRHD